MESRAYLIFSRKNQKLVGLRYPTDVYKTLWIDPGMAQVQAAMNRAFPGAINTIRDWSDDETKVVIASWSDRHPSIYYLLDRNTHKLRKLFDSAPWITPSVAGRTYPLSYRTHDGLVVHGYITLPPGSTGKNLPMVVIANTGLIFERTSLSYDSFIQLLANHGYAVLRVNPRGTPGYGEAFFEAGRKQAGRAIQNDITEAVQWAIEKGIADPHRIAITGADYGGFSAEWGLVNTPDLYRCGVSIEGICDWMAYLKFFDTGISFVKRSGADMNKGLYGYLKNEVGDVKEDAAMLRDISPVNHVDRIKAPMLLFCSKEVYRQFQYDQTQEFADALKSHGAAYNITVFPKVDDSTDWYKNRLAMFTQILAFLDKNMK
jgi:dipeptidyl aminopeptidase/acylaminoacyl peptidase